MREITEIRTSNSIEVRPQNPPEAHRNEIGPETDGARTTDATRPFNRTSARDPSRAKYGRLSLS